jgi:hypothetical protein
LRAAETALLLLAAHSVVNAQNVTFLPETDVYLKLSLFWGTYLQAKNDRGAVGPERPAVRKTTAQAEKHHDC